MSDGSHYVGDEWVYLTDDGSMLGLPEPIRIWAWQFDQLPALLRARPGRDRRRLAAWRGLARLAQSGTHARVPVSTLVRRAQPVLGRQAYLQVPPAELFGAHRVALRGRLDAVVLVMSHESARTESRPVSPTEIAQRMQASLEEERAALMTHYRHFRYAFPHRTNPVIDNAAELESKLLNSLVNGRPCVKVLHPHPCNVHLLGRTVVGAAKAAYDEAAVSRAPESPPTRAS